MERETILDWVRCAVWVLPRVAVAAAVAVPAVLYVPGALVRQAEAQEREEARARQVLPERMEELRAMRAAAIHALEERAGGPASSDRGTRSSYAEATPRRNSGESELRAMRAAAVHALEEKNY